MIAVLEFELNQIAFVCIAEGKPTVVRATFLVHLWALSGADPRRCFARIWGPSFAVHAHVNAATVCSVSSRKMSRGLGNCLATRPARRRAWRLCLGHGRSAFVQVGTS